MKRYRFLKIFIVLLIPLMLGACSQQWREADASIDDQEMLSTLSSLIPQATLSGNSQLSISELAEDSFTSIYYARDGVGLGNTKNVLAFHNLDFMQQGLSLEEVENVDVFFLNRFNEDGSRDVALVLGLILTDGAEINKIFPAIPGSALIDRDRFEVQFDVTLGSATGVMILSSFDLKDGSEDFKSVIQLRATFVEDGTNFEERLGKFSTLIGYGG